jgi:hypothetical protein
METILIGVIIGLLGIFIGIYLHQNATIGSKIESIRDMLGKIHAEPVVPSGITYLSVLAREAKFWEKLYIQRGDKIIISSTIVTKYITQNDKIVVVDSGTTVDQIPHMLCQGNIAVKVFTNNLLATLLVVPPPEGFNCTLLPGRIDPIYGATYSVPDIEAPLREIEADKIILAATAFSFEKGPMVDRHDLFNYRFKGELVIKALRDPNRTQLIIAVDWTKFSKDIDVGNDLVPVLTPSDWEILKAQKSFVLVTTKPDDSSQTPDAKKARDAIARFTENMNRGGMIIDVCCFPR